MTDKWLLHDIKTPISLRYLAIVLGSIGIVCDFVDLTDLATDHDISAWTGSLPPALFLLALLAHWILRPQLPAGYAPLVTGRNGALWLLALLWSLSQFTT
jgi:hypothetical protein